LEGSSLTGKSSAGKKGGVGGASTGGKQGMADALAEMTKRYEPSRKKYNIDRS